MTEKKFYSETYKAQLFLGKDEVNLTTIKGLFPRLKIVARGELLKIMGDAAEISRFELFYETVIWHIDRYSMLKTNDIMAIYNAPSDTAYKVQNSGENGLLVYGNRGIAIKARTKNQLEMVKSIEAKDLLFAIGPAGTGKTYTAVALAVRSLKNKEVKRIILTRPAVEAGENLGFLPGDMKEKLDPYLQPLFDALRDMYPTQKLESFMEEGIIEIAPLAYMRGRTLDNAFVILDEAQNVSESQLKMFLTRMGKSSKFIITGDKTQIDLPSKQRSGLIQAEKILNNISDIDFVYLDEHDIVRHKIVRSIIKAYEIANQDD